MKIQVFDPPMCCSTGICGPSINPELVRFAADLEWLTRQGVEVERYNVSQQPAAFANNSVVRAALAADGNTCLPLTLANGQIVCKGRYPSREMLASYAGFDEQTGALDNKQDKPEARRSSCCSQSPAEKEDSSKKQPGKRSCCSDD
jgi:hypothetical protein